MAGLRYVLAIALRTQRWAPPAIVLVILITWTWLAPPLMLTAASVVALLLFALASWLGYALSTAEGAGQEAIAVSACGSLGRLTRARWAAATLLSVPYPLILLVGSYLLDAYIDHPGLAAVCGAGALLMIAAACGAATGALVGGLLPSRPAWAAAVLLIVTLGEAAPAVPPVGLGISTITARGPQPLPQLLWACGLGVAITVAALALASWWHRRSGLGARASEHVQHRD